MQRSWCSFLVPVCLAVGGPAAADVGDLAQRYAERIQPLLVKACGNCHGKPPKDNDLELTGFTTAAEVLAKPAVLEHVVERVRSGDMPPREAPQPTEAEREQMVAWFTAALDAEAAARAGDPGPVMLRRLTNAEYDNAVRDLAGVDMRPTVAREFPPDAVGGEGFANVGEAMPMTPVLVERYHQAARDVAARAVLLPTGFRFSASPDRPEWTAEAEKALRGFHSRYSGPAGEPPLERHLAATLRHRDRLASGGADAIAAVAAEEKLSVPYLTALWTGLTGPAASPVEDVPRATQWLEKVAHIEAEKQRLQAALQAGKQKIDSGWATAKRVIAESKVDEGGSASFEQKVAVRRGEILLLTVLPNKSIAGDSTLVEWAIRETTGEKRSWSIADLVPDLLKGNPWEDTHGARWSFLALAPNPVFLIEKRDKVAGRAELKSWNLGDSPAVGVNAALESVKLGGATLPAESFGVHPGNNRPVAVAWTSPIDAEVVITGRIADENQTEGDGVAFELAHVAAPELGQALADLRLDPAAVPGAGPPPATMGLVREMWRAATTDPKPVMQAIKTLQDRLFWRRSGNNVLAVGNGFPAWEQTLRVVAEERAQAAAREPMFRLVTRQVAPAQPGTFVIWDRLRLELGDGPTLVLAEHPELRAAIESSGLRFGQHPLGRRVPPTALVTEAPSVVTIDLGKLPKPLIDALVLPRFLRADVRLDEGGPETATVQAVLLGQRDDYPMALQAGKQLRPWRSGDPLVIDEPEPRVAQIVHPRVVAERARPAADFQGLFPPAVLFEPLIPRDAQGSLFMFHREDEPLRRLLLDDAGREELEKLWAELHFVSQDAVANARMYDELLGYYHQPSEPPMMFFHIQTVGDRVREEKADLVAAEAAAEPRHLDQLLAFAARAWRRPLAEEEREAVLAGYKADRADGLGHDPAFRAALARVIASPWFLYRVEEPARGPRWQPVTGLELATRLSFLLWDSIPDDELMAAAPRLHEPAVMEEQLRRMLKDGRTRGMAEEFGARWLGVRDFVANHGRSLDDFPEFTPAVRDSLAEEPSRFIEDLLVHDRPVIDLISADAVVVNDVLAKHYGIPGVSGPQWRRVEKVAAHGRGGLLGFGAVLAKQSAAARTSPIKRGAWLAQMLGERLPNPPPDVPPLPETVPDGLTVREITERHSQDPRCAGCHCRIDPYGMTLGQFDALGRMRPAGTLKPGETRATLRDGTVIDDIAGLRSYLAGPRRDDLLRSLARKLTGYALGRAALPSDRPLVDTLTKTMAAGGRWSDALLVIVQSEQFRCIRPTASVAAASP
jgi:hypothetical protein